MIVDDIPSFSVEYAKSSRGKCFGCKSPVPEGHLRIGPMVQSPHGDFKYPQWHHVKCFQEKWLSKPAKAATLVSVEQIKGCDKLKLDDIHKITALVPGGSSASGGGAASSSAVEDPAWVSQQKAIDAMRAKLDTLDTSTLKAICDANRQPSSGKIFGGRSALLERVLDGVLFGKLPRCATCRGNLRISGDSYKCTGYVDEYTKCPESYTDVARKPFDLDEADEAVKEELKALGVASTVKKRILSRITGGVALSEHKEAVKRKASELSSDGAKAAAAGDGVATALSGVEVVLAGTFDKSAKFYKALLEGVGATVAATVKNTTVLVIASDAELEAKSSKKFKAAEAKGVPIFHATLLAEIEKTKGHLAAHTLTDFLRVQNNWDGVSPLLPQQTSSGDAAAPATTKSSMLKSERSRSRKVVVKGRGAVDPDCEVADEAHVYEDSKSVLYTATLSKSDVTTGQNSFYILQLLQSDLNTNKYWLYRSWGRIGTDHTAQKLERLSLEAAKKEFLFQFEDKTRNVWGEPFRKKPGLYELLETHTSDAADDVDALTNAYNGPLAEATVNLLRLIFDRKLIQSSLVELELDTERMPLGKLSQATIIEAYKVLNDILQVLRENPHLATGASSSAAVTGAAESRDVKMCGADDTSSSSSSDSSSSSSSESSDDSDSSSSSESAAPPRKRSATASKVTTASSRRAPHMTPAAKLISYTNRFYSLVPHIVDAGAKLPPLSSEDLVNEKVALLDALRDLTTSLESISRARAVAASPGKHPIDSRYEALSVEMQLLPRDSEMFGKIATYADLTHGKTHTTYQLDLVDLWEVNRHSELESYRPYESFHNRQLLWHGSRLSNWAGILSQGLLIAPPEAPVTGYMFGKGIYFADMVTKSANYCFTTSEADTGLLVLCEVALGDVMELTAAKYVEKLEKGKHSVKALGVYTPDPSTFTTSPHGALIPSGKGIASNVKNTTLQYNEYVVYTTTAVRIRYLCKFKFNYKHAAGTFF